MMAPPETPAFPKKSDFIRLVSLFVMAAGLFIPHLVQGLSALDRPEILDIINQWVPFKAFMSEVYRQGSFPLWDPHDMCGMPFMAFAHTGSLYLPGSLIYTLASFHFATSLNVFFHLLVAAFSMYIFLRNIPCRPDIAFLGAAAYTFSGFIFANINFVPTLATTAWLPLLFLGVHQIIVKGSGAGFIISALATLLCMLGGDTETLIYAMMGVLYYTLVTAGRLSSRAMHKTLLTVLFALALGIILSLAQFLPLLELNHFSVRGEGFSARIPFPDQWWVPLAFIGLVIYPVPQPAAAFPPNQGLDPFYLGFIFFPFFVLALSKGTGPIPRRLAGFFLLVMAYLLFIYAPPFHGIASRVPILSALIVPSRAFPVIEIYLFYIAAIGMKEFLSRPQAHPLFPKRLLVYFLAYGLIVLVVTLAFKEAVPARLVLAALLLAWPFWKKRIPLNIALVILLIADIYVMAWIHVPKTGGNDIRPHPEVESLITDTGVQSRYFILTSGRIIDSNLPYHLGMRLGADTIDSWSRMPPLYPARVLGMILPGIFHQEDGKVVSYDQMAIRGQDKIRAHGIPIFSLLNVRWLISYIPWNPPQDKIRLRKLPHTLFHIYENMDRLPRAFVVHNYRYFTDNEILRSEMQKPGFNMAGEVLLFGKPDKDQPGARLSAKKGRQAETVTLERPAPDRLLASVNMHSDGYLFLSESWYPGWQVLVDEEPARIKRANYAFRAVRLGPGSHKLKFSYRPLSFRIGLWAGMASILCFLGFMGLYLSRKKPDLRAVDRE